MPSKVGESSAKTASREPKFRRRAEARPDEVLDAALLEFAERGFAQTKVEDIARKAGISKGAVYLYFPSKRSLLEGLVRRAVSPMAKNAAKLAAGVKGSSLDVIVLILKGIVHQLKNPKNVAIPKLILHEALTLPEVAEFYRNAVLDVAVPTMRTLVEQGIKSGEIRPLDPDLTVRSIVGPVLVHLMLSEVFDVRPEGGLRFDDLLENHIAILTQGLRAKGELS
ncbi:MAG: TetR/AcrR family transcriptional regulator [Hyphomicrobiaceae bacterium]|nr:TetR/AcrR family transcriptional regulator [Hyphomicrobiaceae bacterium]